MSRRLVKKPGYMMRAVVAWIILNTILLVVLLAVVWLVGSDNVTNWYIAVPLLIGIIVSEWIIMAETVAPVIFDWIKQEEWKEDGQP
jgi:hypothetical protein